jgi:hypothetical protein
LNEATRERFDFDPRGTPEARAASVARWEAWWQARNQDPLLDPKAAGKVDGRSSGANRVSDD